MQGSDSLVLFRKVGEYVGFGPKDSACLRSFHPFVEPHLGTIVNDFYARIEKDREAFRVFTGGRAQIDRLKGILRSWLARFLTGPHDAEFAGLQARIGRTHVAIGLDQWYMVSGITVFREHLNRILIRTHGNRPVRAAAVQRAYVRLFDITLAIMLETYRESFLRKIVETEQNATLRRLAAIGEVAASLAHEIRNPLAGISGAIQILRDAPAGGSDHQGVLEAVSGEIHRLDSRVNDLLLYARPATIRREPVDVCDLLETTVRVLAGDPQLGRVTVRVRAPQRGAIVPIDPDQIRQVVVNLLLNAAQALGGRGEVRLEAREAERDRLEITVEDSGPGVSPDLAERIFLPFMTTRSGGTGLGLAISRKIAESHGGSLHVEPAPGGGARFVLLLPFPKEPA